MFYAVSNLVVLSRQRIGCGLSRDRYSDTRSLQAGQSAILPEIYEGLYRNREKVTTQPITDPKEVAPFLKAIDGYEGGFVVKCALRLAPLFFVRPGELRYAE